MVQVYELSQQVEAGKRQVEDLERAAHKPRSNTEGNGDAPRLREETERLREEAERLREEAERLREELAKAGREEERLREERRSAEERRQRRDDEVRDLHREVKSLIEKKKWAEGEVERLRWKIFIVTNQPSGRRFAWLWRQASMYVINVGKKFLIFFSLVFL